MEKILFVNACARENSRTLDIAKIVLEKLNNAYTEMNLQKTDLKPLNRESLDIREKLILQDDFSDTMFSLAKDFAAADKIVIAAPYWDLTFPALLKIYLEQITVAALRLNTQKVFHTVCAKPKHLFMLRLPVV